MIHGEQKSSEDEETDGRNSPPAVDHSRVMDMGGGVPALYPKEKPPINVVGDVGGRIAIMVVSEGGGGVDRRVGKIEMDGVPPYVYVRMYVYRYKCMVALRVVYRRPMRHEGRR